MMFISWQYNFKVIQQFHNFVKVENKKSNNIWYYITCDPKFGWDMHDIALISMKLMNK